jgi:DNA topoisomerase II
VTGGMHGYGAKLTNIFSNSFELEVFDAKKNLKYRQHWSDHMTNVFPPEIHEGSGSSSSPQSHSESYTQVTFTPDLKLFSTSLSPKDPSIADVTDILQLFYRRALDLSGVGLFGISSHRPIEVIFNGKRVPVNSFAQYMELFSSSPESDAPLNDIDQNETHSRIHQAPKLLRLNDQWEIGIIPSPTGSFEQMSFVNSVWTSRGGTHVNHITLQCVKYIQEVLMNLGDASAQASSTPISPAKIKNHLMLFVNCLVENPSFDSQGKESLTTKLSQFASQSEISTKYLKKIFAAKSELIQAIYEANAHRPSLAKPLKGKFGKSILVDGLEDAHDAGSGNYRSRCTLIVTEGESAKALAIAGLLSLSPPPPPHTLSPPLPLLYNP